MIARGRKITDKSHPGAGDYPPVTPQTFAAWLLVLPPVAAFLNRSGDVAPANVFFFAAWAIVPFPRLIVREIERWP
jgi:hypothetical protein